MKTLSVMTASAAVLGMVTACTTAPTTNAVNYGVSALNRTLPERMIDEGIEHNIIKNLPNVAGLENMDDRTLRVIVDSFRGEVLLTGEVPSEAIKNNIENMAKSMREVSQVHNYLQILPSPKSPSHTTHENFLKSKIRAKIIANRTATSPQYKLALRSDVVYLMGHVSPAQQNSIVDAINATMGIQKLVLLATLLDDGAVQGSDDVSYERATNTTYEQMATENKAPIGDKAPIVRLDETPVSDYVRLYNNTTNP